MRFAASAKNRLASTRGCPRCHAATVARGKSKRRFRKSGRPARRECRTIAGSPRSRRRRKPRTRLLPRHAMRTASPAEPRSSPRPTLRGCQGSRRRTRIERRARLGVRPRSRGSVAARAAHIARTAARRRRVRTAQRSRSRRVWQPSRCCRWWSAAQSRSAAVRAARIQPWRPRAYASGIARRNVGVCDHAFV